MVNNPNWGQRIEVPTPHGSELVQIADLYLGENGFEAVLARYDGEVFARLVRRPTWRVIDEGKFRECLPSVAAQIQKVVRKRFPTVSSTTQPPTEGVPMGTGSIAPEPRISNGKAAPVSEELNASTVLTDKQKAELARAKAVKAAAPAKKTTGKRTPAKTKLTEVAGDIKSTATKETPKPKAEKPETPAEPKPEKVTRASLQAALIAVRPHIRTAADAVEADDLNTYIAEMDNIVAQANVAIGVGQAMIAQLRA